MAHDVVEHCEDVNCPYETTDKLLVLRSRRQAEQLREAIKELRDRYLKEGIRQVVAVDVASDLDNILLVQVNDPVTLSREEAERQVSWLQRCAILFQLNSEPVPEDLIAAIKSLEEALP